MIIFWFFILYKYSIVFKNDYSVFLFGKLIATILNCGFVVFLIGNLGAGKTVFAKGIISGCFGKNICVKSPTFSVLEVYNTFDFYIYHFDLYRINNKNELDSIGFYDYLFGKFVLIIEWPEKFFYYFPKPHLIVNIIVLPDFSRVLNLESDFINFKSLLG